MNAQQVRVVDVVVPLAGGFPMTVEKITQDGLHLVYFTPERTVERRTLPGMTLRIATPAEIAANKARF